MKGSISAGVVLLSGLLCEVCLAAGGASARLTGSLTGSVRDLAGVPQMGATLALYNRYEKLVHKTLTDVRGEFRFESLMPDVYSVRVTLSSFMPATKTNIVVEPGMQSVLAISLASVLSSIELVYVSPKLGTLMSDDWKWVLRSTMATRPVLRALPGTRTYPGESSSAEAPWFSDTRGLVRVSTGESHPFASIGNQPDLGTAFALATSVFGRNQVQVTGNVGLGGAAELPSAAIQTRFSRSERGIAEGPEFKLTMRQISLPFRSGAVIGRGDNLPALRTMSATFVDRIEFGDAVKLQYGAMLESVNFFDRLNYLSPFARASVHLDEDFWVEGGFSSGAPAVELLQAETGADAAMQQDLAALSVLPRVSLRNGAARVQRSQTFELAAHRRMGSRTFSVGVYQETMGDAAVTLAGDLTGVALDDVLPELSSRSSVFNAGRFQRSGYHAAATQRISDRYSLTVAYGSTGVLRAVEAQLMSDDAEALRNLIRPARQQWIMTKFAGTLPVTNTRFSTSYQWADRRSIVPPHVFVTQRFQTDAGLNVRVRQPIPTFGGGRSRLEATAELRNLLEQGYLPIRTVDGRQVILTNSPRSLRGGLSFIF